VAAKYINPACCTAGNSPEYARLAADEVLLEVRTLLSNVPDFFRICDMKTSDLFAY
jgi:hypothetical protein